MSLSSKDAKKVKTFTITPYTKGFTSSFTIQDSNGNNVVTNEYFQFKEIYQVIQYPNFAVEIVNYSGTRRVFYNDTPGQSQTIFNTINTALLSWMNSNLN